VGTLLLAQLARGACDILQLRDGYLWDPGAQDYFIPRGLAYQTLNPEVGANQTMAQLEYDLTEFRKMYANSVRLEFVWNQVQVSAQVYDWEKPDRIVRMAEKLGLRLFVLIGFNYAPGWFSDSWKSLRDDGRPSEVVNYEHPDVRSAFSNYVYQVIHRYRDSPTVAAWILGNEFAYFDLWDPGEIKHFLGYDPVSKESFRNFLRAFYTNDIGRLNANWGASYADFSSVVMPESYPAYRTNTPGYYDLVQWRKRSIGDYVAVAAVAARKADTNHLVSYSMVGGIFSGNDADYTCEDAKTIVSCCAAAGAPLSFWSINNYARASVGSEQRSAGFGVAKYRAQSGLPVLVTETGFSSTEEYGEPWRQAAAQPSALWEALVSGAIGVHVFTWNDRDMYRGDYKPREKGFGIVNQDRTYKTLVYRNVLAAFRTMENLKLERLLPGSTDPKPDIQLLWSRHADLLWPRANQENTMIWGALKRLGYQPGLLDDEQFEAGAATNARALFLSRCMAMNPAHLDHIATNVTQAGIHLHANGDIPGECDSYGRRNPNWINRTASLFGLDVTAAAPGLDSGVTNITFQGISFQGASSLGPFSPAYSDGLSSWKVWHGLRAGAGATIVTHKGINQSQSPQPALQVKELPRARTAINTFALGDTYGGTVGAPEQHLWEIRSAWLRAIYRDWFGIVPAIELSGTGGAYVVSDYRRLRNNSIVVLLVNEDTNHASITLSAPTILAGCNVENLTAALRIASNSTGVLPLELEPDEALLIYAYKSQGGVDDSLVNPNQNKIWLTDSPLEVWPAGSNCIVTASYDLKDSGLAISASFERVLAPNLVYARSAAVPVSGKGFVDLAIQIPASNLEDPWYRSSLEGGDYVFHAWLEKNGLPIADTYLAVRLAWPLRALKVPERIIPGGVCQVALGWEELPSYLPEEGGAPLERAPLWQLYRASQQYYRIVVQLLSAGRVVATQEFLTNRGTGQHLFDIPVPADAKGPFTWNALLQTAPGSSVDVLDGFENRDTGADQTYEPPFLFAPWTRYAYDDSALFDAELWASGVHAVQASEGLQSAFLILTNPPAPGAFSGFGMQWTYPTNWALPRDPAQWTNYTFAFDFKEDSGLPCILEMQLKDALNPSGVLHFTNAYGASGNWQTVHASLDRFVVPGWAGHFDSQQVKNLFLNVQMLQTGALYRASIDNVRFVGPKNAALTSAPRDIYDSFDNREFGLLAPWVPYCYSESNAASILAENVANGAGVQGGAAAQLVINNPLNVGAWSGFGLVCDFTTPWSLPADTNLWTNYVFSLSFREANSRPCTLELQVKSDLVNRLEFTRPYAGHGWDTVRADLRDFAAAPGMTFDRTHVQSLVVNIRMAERGTTYAGLFDNIWFDAPDQPIPSGKLTASLQFTNGGTLVIPTFIIDSVSTTAEGHVLLSWLARSNTVYAVLYADKLPPDACFLPLDFHTNLVIDTDGVISALDTNTPLSHARFYRLAVRPRPF
jgi:hypothetical protein